jgi:pilus assembly protein FimV
MYQRPLSIVILALCGSAAAPPALALGFGRIPESLVYGQALDLSVPLRVEPGESLSPACLNAELSLGEQRLPKAAVRLQLEGMGRGAEAARVRIRSNVLVQEPVVAVSLSVGCTGPVSRQFVVFADPPTAFTEAAPTRVAELPPATVTATTGVRTQASPAGPGLATTAGARVSGRATGATRAIGTPARTAKSISATQPVVRGDVRAAPRLKLEEPEALLQAATLAVAAQDAALASPAQVASAAQAAALAAEQRMAALEKNLQDMRGDAAAHRAAMDQMRSRLGQAEDQKGMVWALIALAVALAAVAAWLGLRLRAQQREQQADWRQAAAAAFEAETSPAHASAAGLPLADPSLPPETGAPTSEPADSDTPARPSQAVAHRQDVLPPSALTEETLTRPLSVDELIDLEQQAEFFLVLGEEDAAIDLLMVHLRSTGGISPLPYLKLLEIYRRRQDRESYERMRKRFDRRFNAVAPDWDADPELGRDLQDYPAVLSSLQQAWPAPLDAMAELENLLFRKRSGELFELPAYHDVLTLFAVARDLHRQVDDRPVADVDVLLPLHMGRDLAAAPMQSIFDRLEQSPEAVAANFEDRPTAPIDLDLSDLADAPHSRSGALAPVVVPLRRGRR